MKKHAKRSAAALAAAVCTILMLAQPAAAHVDPPTVTALHAFVGDPLWGLDTPEGPCSGSCRTSEQQWRARRR